MSDIGLDKDHGEREESSWNETLKQESEEQSQRMKEALVEYREILGFFQMSEGPYPDNYHDTLNTPTKHITTAILTVGFGIIKELRGIKEAIISKENSP